MSLSLSSRVTKLEALQAIYDPEVRSALESYDEHLEQVRRRLTAREQAAQQKLEEYEEVGPGMNALVNKYAHLSSELDSVKAQILRLEEDS